MRLRLLRVVGARRATCFGVRRGRYDLAQLAVHSWATSRGMSLGLVPVTRVVTGQARTVERFGARLSSGSPEAKRTGAVP